MPTLSTVAIKLSVSMAFNSAAAMTALPKPSFLSAHYLADATHVTVYGVGMGDVPSLLIDNPQYLSIDVCILNLSVFALLISYTDQSEWLKHPNINLKERADSMLVLPYIGITPDLVLTSNENAITRDLLVYELNRHFANQKHSIDDVLLARLNANIPNLLNDPNASLLLNTHSNANCIVIASGPTLEDHYPYLFELTQKLNPQDHLLLQWIPHLRLCSSIK